MRALLVVNPKATTTTERSRDILVRALRSEVELRVEYTRRRGHAAALARQAVADRVDVVVTLGGDGTVNEVVNGLMPSDGRPDPAAIPALAVVPGGSTNVFAGALGLPREWIEGTGVILEALRERRTRTINLGRADERYFTFCAGMGLDAAVVRRVEIARHRGRVSTPTLYLKTAIGQYLLAYRGRVPAIALERSGQSAEPELATVIVQNTAPWTYLGTRQLHPSPDASFDLGLDVMALRVLHIPSTVRAVTQLLATEPDPRGRQVVRLHDVDSFTLRATRPLPVQLDGDYVGERGKVEFTSVVRALRVVC